MEQQLIDNLLFPIWKSIDKDYKKKYKAEVWQQLEDKIKVSANTDSLAEFYEKLKRLIPFEQVDFIGDHQKNIVQFISSADPYEALELLRSQPGYLVLATRIKNEESKPQTNLFA